MTAGILGRQDGCVQLCCKAGIGAWSCMNHEYKREIVCSNETWQGNLILTYELVRILYLQ